MILLLTVKKKISRHKIQKTLKKMQKMKRLLQYVSSHRNIGIRFYASNMILSLLSDASYLSRPRARSVYGTYAYFGPAHTINGPIACTSKMITNVVSAVSEAELSGGFHAAQDAVQYRRTLHDLGYPQPPTLLRMDNTVAIGLATNTINAKRSKAMDMRYFWIIDRVAQKQFIIQHIPGIWNLADHFTKPLPKHKFYQFLQYMAVNLDNEEAVLKEKPSTITIKQQE